MDHPYLPSQELSILCQPIHPITRTLRTFPKVLGSDQQFSVEPGPVVLVIRTTV